MTGAIFSHDRRHRYSLWRVWDHKLPMVMFIGLNPSTANETEPDNTIKRVQKFAENWGYGGFYMVNLFSIISRKPSVLLTASDPLGPDADFHFFSVRPAL